MSKFRSLFSFPIFLAVTACGSLPDVEVGYYLPKATVAVTVTQSALCIPELGDDGKPKDDGTPIPKVETSVEFKPSYSADIGNGLEKIKVKDFDGTFSAGHVEVTLTDDGRLKSFGTEGTSQISEGLKTIAGLTELVPAVGLKSFGLVPTQAQLEQRTKDACSLIKKLGNKQGVLSLVRTGNVNFAKNKTINIKSQKIKDSHSEYFGMREVSASEYFNVATTKISDNDLQVLKGVYGEFYGFSYVYWLQGEERTEPDCSTEKLTFPYCSNEKEDENNRVVLREPAQGTVIVSTPIKYERNKITYKSYSSEVLVPQNGMKYFIEVPKVPDFGSVGTSFTIAENGKLINIKYTADPGAAPVTSAIETLKGLEKEEDDPVAALKAQSDLIYQQQRALICQNDPKNCPS